MGDELTLALVFSACCEELKVPNSAMSISCPDESFTLKWAIYAGCALSLIKSNSERMQREHELQGVQGAATHLAVVGQERKAFAVSGDEATI